MSRDGREHALGICKHFVVPESQYVIPESGQVCGPCRVRCASGVVLASVDFDDERGKWAAEVNDERADRVLPSELRTKELSIPKQRPKMALGVSLSRP